MKQMNVQNKKIQCIFISYFKQTIAYNKFEAAAIVV